MYLCWYQWIFCCLIYKEGHPAVVQPWDGLSFHFTVAIVAKIPNCWSDHVASVCFYLSASSLYKTNGLKIEILYSISGLLNTKERLHPNLIQLLIKTKSLLLMLNPSLILSYFANINLEGILTEFASYNVIILLYSNTICSTLCLSRWSSTHSQT